MLASEIFQAFPELYEWIEKGGLKLRNAALYVLGTIQNLKVKAVAIA